MLAAQFTGKEYFELNEIPAPKCPKNGLVVKVAACAICGTDRKIMDRQNLKLEGGKKMQMTLPRIIGHEFSGTVAELGGNLEGICVGDAVVVAVTVPCLNCESCRRGYHEVCDNVNIISFHCDGAFAEYVAIDERAVRSGCVVKLKSAQNLEVASLTEPLSCAVNCFELTPVREGDVVVIIGVGAVGCLLVELARIYGTGTTVLLGRSTEQVKIAAVSGADYCFDTSTVVDIKEEIMEITKGRGADVVITACSSPEAQKQALELTGKRGAINFFGGLPRDNSLVELDTNLIHYKELMVVGSSNSAPRHVRKALEFIETGRIDMSKYISHRFSLKDINAAMDVARRPPRLRVLVKP